MSVPAPIVIGGSGGSGTRVVARVLLAAGVDLGVKRNVSEDAVELVPVYDRWIDRYTARAEHPLTGAELDDMARDLSDAIARHVVGVRSDGAWGWKNPRSLFLLPFIHECIPALRFLHVLRDGRDVATSSNQNQLDRHGHGWLSPRERTFDRPVQSVLLWRRLNEAMCEYGETAMGEAYTRVRLEDLCQDPETSIRRLYERTGLDGRANPRRVAEIEVTPPASLGRWRTLDPEMRDRLTSAGASALVRFGYTLPQL